MNDHVHQACKWCYAGLWGVLTKWFKVPSDPPLLPSGKTLRAFKPSDHYLQYLRLFFWIGCVAIDLALLIVWIVITVAEPWVGLLITPLMLFIMIIPDVIAYIAIHLKFDTTWYVLDDRAMRIRRGIWIIHETTITFANIQNISLNQGPLERYFGFSNLVVETAGGGGGGEKGGHSNMMGAHHGIMIGLSNATEIRDQIMARVRQCKSAGLGDDSNKTPQEASNRFQEHHISLLKDIDRLSAQLAAQT